MVTSFIPSSLQYLWSAWNVRGIMVLSLSSQLVLALAAPFRKKTSDRFTIFVVWSTYLLADWAPVFAFGLISSAGCRNLGDNREVPQDVMAFWASFLLIHIGGPDTITVFSLEDNALWPRHLVGLITQLFAFLYVFVKKLPHNRLLAPTALIFVAGMIKYSERTRALYLASLENLKKSIRKNPSSDEGSGGDDEEARFTDELRLAFHFHRVFKGLLVDIMPNLAEWHESRGFFLNKDAHEVLWMMTVELNFLYEVLYTKIVAVNSWWGAFARSVAYCIVLTAVILFFLVKKDDFRGVDVAISYSLLAGVFALDTAGGMMATYSPWTTGSMYLGCQIAGMGFLPFLVGIFLLWAMAFVVRGSAVEVLAKRLWSHKMGSFNLLSYCFKEHRFAHHLRAGFIWEKLAEMRHTSKESVVFPLWRFIFEKLRAKAATAVDADKVRRVRDARGDLALEESGCRELMRYIDDYEYDNALLLWHVAAEICYNIDKDVDNSSDMRRLRKMLSDYLLYLLKERPKMMSTVAGISHLRYEDTCAEAKEIGRNHSIRNMLEFCVVILEEQGNITEPVVQVQQENRCANSVLRDSCELARMLRQTNDKWMIICKVLVEMLSYAACHCKADSHARMLSEGGELVTFVWLLMAHFGIVPRYPIK